MPIRADAVKVYVPSSKPEDVVPAHVYIDIDELLKPDWLLHELVDGDSDHDVAGRFFDVTALTVGQRDKVRATYEAIGWRVWWAESRETKRVLMQFVPDTLAEEMATPAGYHAKVAETKRR